MGLKVVKMIDWARVEELRAEIGDEGFAEVVDLFLDEVEEVVMRLRASKDRRRLEDDLHFLKGSAWNLGFSEFGAQCQLGERTAASGQAETVNVAAILDTYGRSKVAFIAGLSDPAQRSPSRAA